MAPDTERSEAPDLGTGAQVPVSALLMRFVHELMADPARQRVSLGELIDAFGTHSAALGMIMLSLPNFVPVPGISTVVAIPIAFIAFQLMIGKRRPILPGILARRSFERGTFSAAVARGLPHVQSLERMVKPRAGALVRGPMIMLVGAVCLMLAFVLMLPIPFGNAPPAIAIILFSLGIIGRDGLCIGAGLAATFASIAIITLVLGSGFYAVFG